MPRLRSASTIARDAAYRKEHAADIAARTRAWAKANPEKRKATDRAYREKNKDKIREQKKAWRKANPEKLKAAAWRWRLNKFMSPSEFAARFDDQGGKCAICGSSDPGKRGTSRLCVDHCHATGKVRGLLCGWCNKMLGLARDNIETLENAIKYLEAWK